MEGLLKSILQKLDELYRHIVESRLATRPGNITKVQRLFQLVMFSHRPPTILEVGQIVALDACDDIITLEDLNNNQPTNMIRRLTKLSGGFLETKQQELGGGQEFVVQFIHQTVREFIINQPSGSKLFMSKVEGQKYIASICTRYVGFLEVEGCLSPKASTDWTAEDLWNYITTIQGLDLLGFVISWVESSDYNWEAGEFPKPDVGRILDFLDISPAMSAAVRLGSSSAAVELLKVCTEIIFSLL